MSIVESDGPLSWSLDACETGESTKYPWVGVVEGTAGGKNRDCNSFTLSRVQRLWLSLGATANQINQQSPLLVIKPVKSGKYDINYMLLCSCEFRDIFLNSRLLVKSIQCSY